MAGDIGYYKKNNRGLYIVTGNKLMDGSKQGATAAAASLEDGSTEVFYSGQPIWLTDLEGTTAYGFGSNEFFWTTVPQTGKAPYYAVQDSFEQIASDLIRGISGLDTYELQVPFYDTSKVYTPGEALTAKVVASASLDVGNKPYATVTSGSGDDAVTGYVLVTNDVVEGDDIIGYVTKGQVQVQTAEFSEPTVTTDSDGKITITGVTPFVNTENSKTTKVLQFSTAFSVGVAIEEEE